MPLDLRDHPTDLPQATLPQTADYPTVTSRDPAAMRRTNASSDLSSTGARQSLTRGGLQRGVEDPRRSAAAVLRQRSPCDPCVSVPLGPYGGRHRPYSPFPDTTPRPG